MITIKLTPPEFSKVHDQVRSATGQLITIPRGSVTHDGVTLSYSYDGEQIEITVVKKPFFVSEAYVEDQIHAWFAGS